MKLVKIIDGVPVPYSYAEFRADNASTLYGRVITSDQLAAHDVFRVRTEPMPEAPSGYRAVIQSIPALDENGVWVLRWDVIPLTPQEAAAALADERASMKCSRLQGRLVLGEATCDALDAMAADDLTPWAMRQTIQNAIEWSRTSQSMTELGYLLGYTPDQMDELFRLAMTVDV